VEVFSRCCTKLSTRKLEASLFLLFAGLLKWAMLGSNQRPLPCEGSAMVSWRFLELAEFLQIAIFLN
jgi:hypothetical protein